MGRLASGAARSVKSHRYLESVAFASPLSARCSRRSSSAMRPKVVRALRQSGQLFLLPLGSGIDTIEQKPLGLVSLLACVQQ